MLFAVYIHWPFCRSKCPYCDFNSHVRETIDQRAWQQAYAREISYYASQIPEQSVTSIFFGGGTPSLMEPETVANVLEAVKANWDVDPAVEITMEANPSSVETQRFAGYAQAGVNRLSLGVQSLDDDVLRFLGRNHDVKQALRSIDIANKNFERVSFDLIYARPGQSLQSWACELGEALEYAGDHLSLYQLTIEPGTRFYTQHERGDFSVPDDEQAGAMYEQTQVQMEQAGLPAYEISNHARQGSESRHNLTYWRYGDYVGIGPGAHGRLTLDGRKTATRAHRAPEIWMGRVERHGHGGHDWEDISEEQSFTESLMMGLRLKEGVPWARLGNRKNNLDSRKLEALAEEGLLHVDDERLIATPAGLQRLNGVLAYLLT